MANQTSGTSIPGYKVIRKIGSGGSAVVYLAVQHSLNRRVALKLVRGTLTSEPRFGERFKREGRIVAQFNHLHIIPVYDIGEHDNQYYMSMEYLSGGDLRSQAEQLTLKELLEVMLQITQALQVAHERGIVHRDIKPANILFRHPGQAVITDFGIARQTESLTQMTVTGTMLGTPAYMSPEQINGHALDGRADLYSLGVTLFEMLTGFQPYRGESVMNVAMQQAHAQIPRLPKASAQLQSLIDRLLAKEPGDRIDNAEALESELEKLLELPEKLEAPLTSLWPDKAPEIDSRHVFSGKAGDAQTSGKKTDSTGRIAGTVAVVLIAAFGAIAWYAIDLPPGNDSSTISTTPINTDPPARIDDTPVIQVPVQEQKPAPWQETLEQANQLFEKGQMISPQDNNALTLYRRVLQQDSGNVIARNGEQTILRRLVLEVEQFIVNHSLDKADQQLAALNNLWPDEEKLEPLRNRIAQSRKRIKAGNLALEKAEKQREIDGNLLTATAAMIAGRYLKPPGDSALFYFRRTLSIDPDNETAKRGLAQISDALISQIQAEISNNNFSQAESILEDFRSVDPKNPQLQSSGNDIATAKAAYLQQQVEEKRLAELQSEIDRLSDRVSEWRLGNKGLDAQSSDGDQLVAEISVLLAAHSENSRLRALYDSTKQRLEDLSEHQQMELSTQQKKPPRRKPIVGGF